jgi:hypothetical protein
VVATLEAEHRTVAGETLGQLQRGLDGGGARRAHGLHDHVELARGQDGALNGLEEVALLSGERVERVQELARTQVLDGDVD